MTRREVFNAAVATPVAIASVPALLAGPDEVLAYARPLQPHDASHRRVNEVATALRTARMKFAAAKADAEKARPEPSLSVISEGQGGKIPGYFCKNERRRFDGEILFRRTNERGFKEPYVLGSSVLLLEDINDPDIRGRDRRRALRAFRNVRQFETAVARAERDVEELKFAVDDHSQRINELVDNLMSRPALTRADVELKVHAIAAFTAADDEQWRKFEAGRYSAQLAREMLVVWGRHDLLEGACGSIHDDLPHPIRQANVIEDADLLALRPAWLKAWRDFDAALDQLGVVEERIHARGLAFPDFKAWEGSIADYTAESTRLGKIREAIEAEEGLPRVKQLENDTSDAQAAVLEQIEAIQAHTLAGLRFKVEVSIREDHNRAEIIQSIMADILAMAEGASA